MKKLQKTFILICLFTFLLALASCGNTTKHDLVPEVDFSESNQKSTSILVWADDTDGTFMEKLIPAFNEVYPNIEVKFQHMATVDSREKLKTVGPSGLGADVFQFPHDHMSQAILEDLVLTLPDAMKVRLEERVADVAMDIATAYYDPATKSFDKVEGASEQLFAVPLSIESIFLWVNTSLIDPADVPTDWTSFIEYGKQWEIDNPGKKFFVTNSHWADSYFLQTYLSAFGWRPMGANGADAGYVGFCETDGTPNAKLTAATKWLRDELKPLVVGNGSHNSVGSAKFEAGEAAIVLSGPWSTQSYTTKGFDIVGKVLPAFTNIEGATYTPSTFAGAQMMAVYKYSPNQEAAMKFVEFLTSDTAAQILYTTSGDCPALKTELINSIDGLKEDQLIQTMLTQLETSIPMPIIPEITHYWSPAETLFKNVLNNNADIENEQKEAQKSYEAKVSLVG